MKKILFGIIAFLGIGLSFCSADDQCTSGYLNNFSNISYKFALFPFELNPFGAYSFSSFSISGFYLSQFNSIDLFLCYTGGDISNWGSVYNSDLESYFYCESLSYNYENKNLNTFVTVSFSDPVFIPLGTKYLIFKFVNNSQNFSIKYSTFSYPSSKYISIPIDSNLSSFFTSNFYIPNHLFDVCYSVSLSPKLKVNYGNTSYEYEIDGSNDVEIHLKSPVVMSGSYNYVYDGPIGINLFYNNTSQFYDKDKLYLKSMYWYNKNIFTPICL